MRRWPVASISRVYDVLKRLEENIEQTETVKSCFGILSIISREEPNKLVIAREGLDIILSAIDKAMDKVEVQEAGCDLLWSLAFNNNVVKDTVGRHGGIGILVKAIKRYHSVSTFLKSACGALSNLCQNKQNQNAVASFGGIPPVVGCVEIYQTNAMILPFVLDAISSLIVGNEDNARLVSSQGAIPLILVAMNSNTASGDVAKSGCHTLAILSDVKGQATRIVSSNGIGVILPLLQLHSGHKDLYRVAAVIILRMLQESPTAAREVVAIDGLKILFLAVKEQIRQSDTIAALSHVLFTITDRNVLDGISAATVEKQLWLTPDKTPVSRITSNHVLANVPVPISTTASECGPSVVLRVLEEYLLRKDIVRAGCRLLSNLQSYGGVVVALEATGAIEIIFTCVNQHPDARDITDCGIRILKAAAMRVALRPFSKRVAPAALGLLHVLEGRLTDEELVAASFTVLRRTKETVLHFSASLAPWEQHAFKIALQVLDQSTATTQTEQKDHVHVWNPSKAKYLEAVLDFLSAMGETNLLSSSQISGIALDPLIQRLASSNVGLTPTLAHKMYHLYTYLPVPAPLKLLELSASTSTTEIEFRHSIEGSANGTVDAGESNGRQTHIPLQIQTQVQSQSRPVSTDSGSPTGMGVSSSPGISLSRPASYSSIQRPISVSLNGAGGEGAGIRRPSLTLYKGTNKFFEAVEIFESKVKREDTVPKETETKIDTQTQAKGSVCNQDSEDLRNHPEENMILHPPPFLEYIAEADSTFSPKSSITPNIQPPESLRMHIVYECPHAAGLDVPSKIPTPCPYDAPPNGVGPPFSHSLKFDSGFESANLLKVVQRGEHEYDLFLRADLHTLGHTQWFYFAISNTHPQSSNLNPHSGAPGNRMHSFPFMSNRGRSNAYARFNIVNLTKPESLFSQGMRVVMYSYHDAKTKSTGWIRAGNRIEYRCTEANPFSNDAEATTFYSLSFTLEFPNPDDVYLVAHSYPYTFNYHQKHVNSLVERPESRRVLRRWRLCTTLAGHPCDVVTFTNFSHKNVGPLTRPLDSQHSPPIAAITGSSRKASTTQELKKAIFISGRVHPGETLASWMMKGILDFLASKSTLAELLRDNFVIFVVPMLNPDGVIFGNNRCSLAGVDLNRQWKRPSKALHPTIHALKSLMRFQRDKCRREIFMYVDLHGHSRKFNVFMYGCDDKKRPRPQVRAFPQYLSAHPEGSKYVNYADCSFHVKKGRETTARVVVCRELGIEHSYTLEASFAGANFGPLTNAHFNTGHLEEVGRVLCEAILGFAASEGPLRHVEEVMAALSLNTSGVSSQTQDMAQTGVGGQEDSDVESETTDNGSDSKPVKSANRRGVSEDPARKAADLKTGTKKKNASKKLADKSEDTEELVPVEKHSRSRLQQRLLPQQHQSVLGQQARSAQQSPAGVRTESQATFTAGQGQGQGPRPRRRDTLRSVELNLDVLTMRQQEATAPCVLLIGSLHTQIPSQMRIANKSLASSEHANQRRGSVASSTAAVVSLGKAVGPSRLRPVSRTLKEAITYGQGNMNEDVGSDAHTHAHALHLQGLDLSGRQVVVSGVGSLLSSPHTHVHTHSAPSPSRPTSSPKG